MNEATKDIAWMQVQFCGSARLLYFSIAQDHNAIRHRHGLVLVMGDINSRHLEAAEELHEFRAHALAQARIQARKRFIQEEDARLCCQSTGNRDSLLLST